MMKVANQSHLEDLQAVQLRRTPPLGVARADRAVLVVPRNGERGTFRPHRALRATLKPTRTA